MLKIAIILGSTRPGRIGEAVARWVFERARQRGDAEFELVDIADYHLPLLDEPIPPSPASTAAAHEGVGREDRRLRRLRLRDARVQPRHVRGAQERHRLPVREWNNKAAGFVSYGSAGGARAVEHLRLVMAELQVATSGPR